MRRYFKAEENYNGDNWLLAFGAELDGKSYSLTTDHVHASELHDVSEGAKGDCELVANLLNWYYNTLSAPQTIARFVTALDKEDPK